MEFILDADTVLESDNYIARTVEELYKAGGIASACGTILPLRKRDRRAWLEHEQLRTFARSFPRLPFAKDHWWRDFLTGITNLYREVLYLYLQRFIYRARAFSSEPSQTRSDARSRTGASTLKTFSVTSAR